MTPATSRGPRSDGVSRAPFWWTTLLLAIALPGCHPDAILHAPAQARASLLVGYSVSAAARLAAPDQVRVRVSASTGMLADTTIAFPSTSSELRIRLELDVKEQTQTVDVRVDLLENARVVESGGTTVTLKQGETTTASVDAMVLTGTLSLGDQHSCVLRSGTAYCWGRNDQGEVGSGSASGFLSTPTAVSGGPYSIISAGLIHTCALETSGKAWCWGYDFYGQLGNGAKVDSHVPVAAAAGLTFVDISAGGFHTCGLTSAGEVWCWGGLGPELGSGATGNSLVPVKALAPPGVSFAALDAGALNTCALSTGGDAYCWGSNITGQLGDGTATDRSVPTLVAGGHKFQRLGMATVNSYLTTTCAVDLNEAAWCWGNNSNGQLGAAGPFDSCSFATVAYSCAMSPRPVEGGFHFEDIKTGTQHTCGVTVSGAVLCWGANAYGQLGDGSRSDHAAPAPVMLAGGVGELSLGGQHSCWLAQVGLYCWGRSALGQVGTGLDAYEPDPVQLPGAGWREISGASCGVASSGTVSCWGPLSPDSTSLTAAPASIGGPALHAISGALGFACGLDAAGGAWCWGTNPYGLGDGSTTSSVSPRLVGGGRSYSALTTGQAHACAVESQTGYLWCWGYNALGALGDNSTTNSPVPVMALSSVPFRDVAAGASHTCAISTAGDVYCWGFGRVGQLGFPVAPTPGTQLVPAQVPGLSNVALVAGGANHTCAISGGNVYCWGSSLNGALGHTQVAQTGGDPPTPVAGITNATRIAAGPDVSCAIDGSSVLWCWGANPGTFPRATTTTPTRVTGVPNAAQIAAGQNVICALQNSGAAFCWGNGDDGRVGRPLPVVLTPAKVF